jgi:hypothetical protein
MLVGLLAIVRLKEADVQLTARVSEFSFVSAADQELSMPLKLSALHVAGLTHFRIPPSAHQASQRLTRETGWGGNIAIRLGETSGHEDIGTMSLHSLSLNKDDVVGLAIVTNPQRYRVRVHGGAVSFRLSALGSLELSVPGHPTSTRTFQFPRALHFESDPKGLDLDLSVESPPENLVPHPITLKNLFLSHVEERIDERGTSVQEISTILGGSLRFSEMNGHARDLVPGERLKPIAITGQVETIEFDDDALQLRFAGSVRDARSCIGRQCSSLMPSYLTWSITRYPWLLAIVATVYLLSAIRAFHRARQGMQKTHFAWRN